MSRFQHLEFENGQNPEKQRASTALKDEAFYLAEAEAALERAQFEPALRAFAKAMEFNPANPHAWAGQARMLIELGELKEAQLWATQALEKFPNDAELLAAKAVALARAGDHKAALAFSDAAVENRSDFPYAWLARGDVLLARREPRADYCMERALSMAPGDWLLHWLACRTYYYYRQFARALKFAQHALNLDASRAAVWLEFGRCQLALGLAGAAENSFQQARQLDSLCLPARSESERLARRGIWARLREAWQRLWVS